jgi:hypothetical protein
MTCAHKFPALLTLMRPNQFSSLDEAACGSGNGENKLLLSKLQVA